MICIINDKNQKQRIAKKILDDLAEWFGLPESTAEYVHFSKDMPFGLILKRGM